MAIREAPTWEVSARAGENEGATMAKRAMQGSNKGSEGIKMGN